MDGMKSMIKKIIILLICINAFILSLPTLADDLPIDITAIGHQEGYDDALTARFNIELFTPGARKIYQALAEQKQQKWESAAAGLFIAVKDEQPVDEHEQIAETVSEIGLFSVPADYSRIKNPDDTESIPIWLVVTLLSACAIGGFIWAKTSEKKRKEREGHAH